MSCWQANKKGVNFAVMAMHLVVEVRTCGTTGGTDIADGFALLDGRPFDDADGDSIQVSIDRAVDAVMFEFDVVAVVFPRACFLDDSTPGGKKRESRPVLQSPRLDADGCIPRTDLAARQSGMRYRHY